MKPNDQNGKLPPDQRAFRVLIISGSNRRQYNCPGVDSKSRALMLRMADWMPADWEIDYEDLGNVFARARIQSCNACVSTSMALCVWPCNCYERNNREEPDLMWDLDMYSRLDLADAWAVIGPVNWYGPTSNLKLMFDRLVCMNGGNPREDLIEHKNPELAMKFEKTPEFKELSVNHLEGRTCGFFSYGDDAEDERDETGFPIDVKHREYFDPQKEPYRDLRDCYAPLVWQCRFSGIEVPENLWKYHDFGRGKKYSENQAEHISREREFVIEFDSWVRHFTEFVAQKGKVPPGKYRAYGYTPPTHHLADFKLKRREIKIAIGKAPEGSSPQKQDLLGLNRDRRLFPKRSEGKELRK